LRMAVDTLQRRSIVVVGLHSRFLVHSVWVIFKGTRTRYSSVCTYARIGNQWLPSYTSLIHTRMVYSRTEPRPLINK
jgi:hypothetical protein